MSLQANALVEVAEVKEYLQLSVDDISDVPFLERLINGASDAIERHCGREFIKVTTKVSEIWIGDGTTKHFLRNVPILSTIAVGTDLFYFDGTNWTALTTENIRQYSSEKTGWIEFTDGNSFWKDWEWKVTYTYGYERASIPALLKECCFRLIAIKRKLYTGDLHGISVKSFGDQSISYNFDKMPEDVQRGLNIFKRYTTGRIGD